MGTEKSSSLKKFTEMLKEISGYVAAILFYVLALVGYVPPPLPQRYSFTVSTLTILVSLTAFWLWRLPKITEKRSAESSVILVAGGETLPERSFLSIFRSAGSRFYNMPLAQRRLEGALLLSLTALAIGVTGVRIPYILKEISIFYCPEQVAGAPRILVADFNNSTQFGESLAKYMATDADIEMEICRYRRSFTSSDEPEEIGMQYHAALIISGDYSDGLMEVYPTIVDPLWKDVFEMSQPVQESLEQLKDGLPARDSKKEAAFLAKQIAAVILLFEGQPVDAREKLSSALEDPETQGLEDANPELLAEGHFLLGLLLDPHQHPDGSDIPDGERAIAEYSKAIGLNENLSSAYLNRAALYSESGNTQKAIADYSKLILITESSDYRFDAYLQKAELQLKLGMCLEVIPDLETALQDRDAEGYYLYPYLVHNLGRAYLMCGYYDTAENAYRNIPQLEEEYTIIFTEELNDLVSKNPGNRSLEEEVNKIIEYLEQVSNP